MFPIPWNFPFRKKNGDMSTIGAEIGGAGSELPPHSSSDAGKLLGVKPNGSLEWSNTVNSEIQTLTNKLNDEVETRAALGAHNLYKFDLAAAKAANTSGTWNDNVYTVSGATFTVNDDDTITVNTNGTTTQELYFKVGTASLENGKQYKILGCPSGGSNNSYLMAYKKDNSTYAIDTGNGASFTYASTDNKSIEIYIRSGQNLVDAVFKPMICVSTDKATTYQPYAMTNRELTDKVDGVDYEMQYNGAYFHVIKYGDYYHCYSNSNFTSAPSIDDWTTIGSVPNSTNRDFCGILIMNSGVILKVRVKADGNVQIFKVSGTFGSNLYIQCGCVLA